MASSRLCRHVDVTPDGPELCSVPIPWDRWFTGGTRCVGHRDEDTGGCAVHDKLRCRECAPRASEDDPAERERARLERRIAELTSKLRGA